MNSVFCHESKNNKYYASKSEVTPAFITIPESRDYQSESESHVTSRAGGKLEF